LSQPYGADHFITRIRRDPAFRAPDWLLYEDVLLQVLGDDLVLLGDRGVLVGDGRLDLGDPCDLGRLRRLDVTSLLQIEHVGTVLEDGRLPATDLARLEAGLVTQVWDRNPFEEASLDDGSFRGRKPACASGA